MDYSDIGIEVAAEAVDLYGDQELDSNKKQSTGKGKKIDKYEAAIAELKQIAPSNIFETFAQTVALQLEKIHQLDVAKAFSCMQEIQNIIGNKITTLLKAQATAKKTYCNTCSQNQFNSTNSEDHHSNIPHFSAFDSDEPAIYNYQYSPSSTSNSCFKNIKTSSSNSTNVTRSSTSTPINTTKNRQEYLPDFSLTGFSSMSPPQISNFKQSVTTNKRNTTPLTSNSSTLSSKSIVFNPEKNTSTTFNLPEGKKIKILENIIIERDKSSLLNDALAAAGIVYCKGDDFNLNYELQ